MVDYSICGIEIDDEKPFSMTKIIRKQKREIFYQGSLEEIQEVLGSSLHGLFRFSGLCMKIRWFCG